MKKTKSIATLIIALIFIFAGYFWQAGDTQQVSKPQTSETIAQEIQLQDEAFHVICWDVGQADCILIQNKRKKLAY